MGELQQPDITITGLPEEDQDHQKRVFLTSIAELQRQQLAELQPATLTEEQLGQCRDVEEASRDFFYGKMRKLGLPEESLLEFPEVHYTKKPKDGDAEQAGKFDPLTTVTQVFQDGNPTDFFDRLSYIPHELSHATVNRNTEFNFTEGDTTNFSVTNAEGLAFIEDHITRGEGIEEGMVIFDQVDFYHTHLQKMYPNEYERRKQIANPNQQRRRWQDPKISIASEYQKIDPTLYGQLDPELVLPFVVLRAPNVPLLRQYPNPSLNQMQFKEYLFARKLSELVGRNASGNFDVEIDTDDAINAGRDILDRDRYQRTGEARKQITAVLGEENSQIIFDLKDHDEEHIDDAMRVLVAAEEKAKGSIQ